MRRRVSWTRGACLAFLDVLVCVFFSRVVELRVLKVVYRRMLVGGVVEFASGRSAAGVASPTVLPSAAAS
jgi:hypothetical protein